MTEEIKYVYRDGAGTCLTCNGPCDKRSQRCRVCSSSSPTLTCPTCKEDFPREVFTNKAGRRLSYCPTCLAAWHRNNRYLSKYGVTADQVDQWLIEQDNACKICKSPDEGRGMKFLHVDHDHATGEVRGLLCFDCNTGLGKFKDDPKLLAMAIKYLELEKLTLAS